MNLPSPARFGQRASTAPGPYTSRFGLALIAIALFALFSVRHEQFMSYDNFIAIGVNVSAVVIAGFGAAVLVITGNVDLSIGSMYGCLSMVVAQVAVHIANPVFAIIAGLGMGLVFGAVNGCLVRWLRISPIIVTVGMLAVYGGLAYVVSSLPVFGFDDRFVAIGRGRIAGVPVPVVVAAVVALGVGLVLTRTRLGLRLYAIGGDARAAERAGIRTQRLVLGAYTFNGMLIGLIAVLTTAQLGSASPTIGTSFEFDVLTAVILGGVAFTGGAGRPLGIAIGVVTIGILNAGLIFEGLDDWHQDIAKGAILLLALSADQMREAGRQRTLRRGVEHLLRNGHLPSKVVLVEQPAPLERLASEVQDRAVTVLEAREVGKSYGAVVALEQASLEVHAGEVIALLGDNGAGKSTLAKILSGAIQPDVGSLFHQGRPANFHNPANARRAGVETVYQDLALCPNLSIIHNMVLGTEPTKPRFGFIGVRDDKAAADIARVRLQRLGTNVQDLNALVESLSGGQRQAVAIARTLAEHVEVVILDEPTAALGVTQTENVLRSVRSLAEHGTAVVMITHDVKSVIQVCDRAVVLRHGECIFDGPTNQLTELQLLQLMAGVSVDSESIDRDELRAL